MEYEYDEFKQATEKKISRIQFENEELANKVSGCPWTCIVAGFFFTITFQYSVHIWIYCKLYSRIIARKLLIKYGQNIRHSGVLWTLPLYLRECQINILDVCNTRQIIEIGKI